ncbi:prophage tail fiber N-terminal domain-containing protein [Serratia sp. MF2]|uniref:phage tail fiber protein n=1 Tax=Serratia sp. MF2 TaxID=3059173 RepID=UPI0027FF9D0D|nr:prophage tail fiber N-terminal domain-containing protein [Serratia sp. MF2]MDQ7099351.1 prophage tail fiber N-terminal domain-containing protein [Serratia sp. MF2]
MVLISGVLKGPYGDSRSGVTITMRSMKTSSTVLNLSKSQSVTDDTGRYSLNVEPGAYEVIVSVYGAQPERVGTIEVYTDSLPGTLNDFLRRPGEDDITPEIVQTVDRLRAEAALSADKSAASAAAAKISEQNAANSAAQVVNAFDNVRFKFPENNTNTAAWFLLGTFKNVGQNGVGIAVNFYGSNGFNGFTYNAGLSRLMLRTGNLNASDTTNKINRIGGVFINDTGTPILDIQIIESSRDNYDIYVKVGSFTLNCWYTVEQITYANAAGLRWEHKAQKQSVEPVGVMKIDMRMGVSYATALALPGYDYVARASQNGFGLGPQHKNDLFSSDNISSIGRFNSSTLNVPGATLGACITTPMDGGPSCGYIAVTAGRGLWVGSSNSVTNKTITWNRVWSEINTTVDANGFIKKASPIARLSSAPEKMADDYLDGFALSGYAAVNSEAAGVSAERVSVGVYKVTGALGFAEEGWNIEVPQDVNGNRLCFVSANTGKDGTIYVKVSKRRFDIDTAAIVAGEPMDIPAGRWIDLRLEMPVREVEEAPEAVEETAAIENVNVDPI